jgi:FkbM family methyltransferase
MKLTIDLPFNCPDDIRPHLQKVFSGEYEIPLYGPVSTVIDLGANCGSFTLWARHRWPSSTIYAYEPHPDNFKFFAENIKPYANIVGHRCGVGTPGMRVLGDGRFNGGEASFYKVLNNPNPTGQHVEVMDPLTLPEADIIKLDIEGCELEVLEPLIKDGRKFAAILYEYHSEKLRRDIDLLLSDYHLVGSIVESIAGRGVCRYINKTILERS